MPPKSDSWIRRFTVTDPRKHKKGFTVYKVTSVVFPKASPEAVTKVVVWKRYNDFKKLHKELQSRHRKLHLKDKFPQFVKAKYFGRFEDEVIEERRQCALALLEFIAEHAPLFTAHVFVKFFESGYTVDSNDELQAAIQPLQPEALFVDSNNGPSDTSPLSVDSSIHASSCRETDDDKEADVSTRSESEQPMLKLGGTWKFPQVPDSISLSSHSSTDDHTTFTDTDSMLSEVSSPLQSDLQYFDPFHPENQDSVKSPLSEQSTPKFKNSSVQSDNGGSERHNGLVPNAFPTLTGSNSMLELLSESLENSKRNGDKDSVEVKQTLVDIKEEKSSSGDSDSGKQEVQYPCDKEPQPQPVPNEQQDTLSPPLTPSSLVSGSVPDVQQNVNYIFEAAYHISQAQQYEANAEYEKAFSFYKAGIATLLSGVQGDNDSARRQVVREKTGKYLMRAEIIYNKYLSPTIQDDSRWSPNSCMSPQVERNIDVAKLQRPLSELKFFRVLGIVDKVMLVLDTRYPTERCYVMKVLHKSSCPINVSKSSIVPRNVPYMVQMYQYFETDTAVFLLLQHASGGKLWDHVSSYFQTAPLSPSKSPYKNASDFDSNLPNIMKDNAYLGKKLLGRNCDSDTSAKSKELLSSIVTGGNQMLTGSDHSNSYLELIRDYTTSAIKKPFNFLKGGSGEFADTPCEEHDQAKDDQCLVKGGVREIAKDCKEMVLEVDCKTSEPCRLRDGDGSNILDSSTTDDSSPVQQYSAEVGISWRNLEKLDTKDLVENSQKLLESVNETLQKSESISFEKPKEQNNNFESFPHSNHLGEGDGPETKVDVSSHPSVVQCDVKDKSDIPQFLGKGPLVVTVNPLSSKEVDKQQCDNAEGSCRTRTSKIFKKCKSEDLSVSSKKKKERRNSSGRRRSVNSHSRSRLERRYSCDDMFEGRARNASGSFEPSRPVSRLQSLIDIPQPRLPEASIRVWAAELVIAIETLHQLGILCRDLRPDNVLLGEKGHVLLTYMCHWCGIDKVVNNEATESLYVAPEVNGIVDVTDAADWWSFGSLLFELLTGQTVYSCHPGGIQSHTILNIPEYVSVEAGSLLTELLRYHPTERLGSGMNGIENLKAHPFFNGMDWQAIKEAGLHA